MVDRIEIFERVLADRNAPHDQRVEALKFLVHLVGDIHQPLHAIGEARGGNEIHISEFGSQTCGTRPCNLHFAWDIGLLEHEKLREHDYVTHVGKLIASQGIWRQAEGTPTSWANESFELAKKVWLNDGGTVDEAYYRRNIQIVDERLALAGVRPGKSAESNFRRVNASSGKQAIEHEVNHNSGHRNIEPQGISPPGNRAMRVKAFSERATECNDDQRHDRGCQNRVRDQNREIYRPRQSVTLEPNRTDVPVIVQIRN